MPLRPNLPLINQRGSHFELTARIAEFQLPPAPEELLQDADRWVLASNLQKAIRRGLAETAVASAIRLLALDARYFWRRLLVIAYEDVAYGDIGLCHALLKTFRREALHRQLGPDRVAGYFANELAGARKSRSLCDALAALEFSVNRLEYERYCQEMTDDQLLRVACDGSAGVIERVAALRHVCGYREFSNGSYSTIAVPRPELMREVCHRLELSEMETTLFRSGQSVSDSLSIPIPVLAGLVRSGRHGEATAPQAFSGQNGILYAALDRHTRAGKRCFAKLARDSEALRWFFIRRPNLDPVAVLGAGVFIVEGAVLDRRLNFEGADELRLTFNRNFLEYHGVAGKDGEELLRLVADHLLQLNCNRAGEIT